MPLSAVQTGTPAVDALAGLTLLTLFSRYADENARRWRAILEEWYGKSRR